jgi:hypothetical protein
MFYDVHTHAGRSAFGLLTRRWGIFWRALSGARVGKASRIVSTCAKLHDWCIDSGMRSHVSLYQNRQLLSQEFTIGCICICIQAITRAQTWCVTACSNSKSSLNRKMSARTSAGRGRIGAGARKNRTGYATPCATPSPAVTASGRQFRADGRGVRMRPSAPEAFNLVITSFPSFQKESCYAYY